MDDRKLIEVNTRVHAYMCTLLHILEDNNVENYEPSFISAQRLQASAIFSPHVTCAENYILSKFITHWDIDFYSLQNAYDYAISKHWSIDEILYKRYIDYCSLKDISNSLDLLPKTVAYYCMLGTKRFLSAYKQSNRDIHAADIVISDYSALLLLEIDPVLPVLSL